MAFRTHRNAQGQFVAGKHCCNHRSNPPHKLSAFDRLERKIERGEKKRHPGYSSKRLSYISHAAAGKVARGKAAKRR